ncbi:VOC family protein [Novosphingobium resinovorum]|uniref:Lactoylglutathione lyase n=1 Tax=Novosphingobium resinovorum TaxID=158500 RepID=A0A1D8A0D8_9SPHN|nr:MULTISPECIES: VOC family protein [Novosphingobium]AOR75569.1 lactoylglutathione lyase [Novosphingobium resinovorum]MBF7010892.1 VOC family protein [Novosphingobium sp. HR1a]WJM28888.1 VOC family protein [Novosphingobium resinovorum]
MIRGIHHIGMNCRDLERMKRLYCDAPGFAPVDADGLSWAREPVMDHIVDLRGSVAKGYVLRVGGCYIEMFEYTAPPSDLDRPLRPNDRGYTHFRIDVTDIERDIAHLKACGMTFNDRDFVAVGHATRRGASSRCSDVPRATASPSRNCRLSREHG